MAISSCKKSTPCNIFICSNETLLVSFTYKSDGVVVDLTGASLKMEVRQGGPSGVVKATLTTGTGELPITNPTGGEFEIRLSNTVVVADLLDGDNKGSASLDYDVVLSNGGVDAVLLSGSLDIQPGVTT